MLKRLANLFTYYEFLSAAYYTIIILAHIKAMKNNTKNSYIHGLTHGSIAISLLYLKACSISFHQINERQSIVSIPLIQYTDIIFLDRGR